MLLVGDVLLVFMLAAQLSKKDAGQWERLRPAYLAQATCPVPTAVSHVITMASNSQIENTQILYLNLEK